MEELEEEELEVEELEATVEEADAVMTCEVGCAPAPLATPQTFDKEAAATFLKFVFLR